MTTFISFKHPNECLTSARMPLGTALLHGALHTHQQLLQLKSHAMALNQCRSEG